MFGISKALISDDQIRSPVRNEHNGLTLASCKQSEPLPEAVRREFDELWEKNNPKKVHKKSKFGRGIEFIQRYLPFLKSKKEDVLEPNHGPNDDDGPSSPPPPPPKCETDI